MRVRVRVTSSVRGRLLGRSPLRDGGGVPGRHLLLVDGVLDRCELPLLLLVARPRALAQVARALGRLVLPVGDVAVVDAPHVVRLRLALDGGAALRVTAGEDGLLALAGLPRGWLLVALLHRRLVVVALTLERPVGGHRRGVVRLDLLGGRPLLGGVALVLAHAQVGRAVGRAAHLGLLAVVLAPLRRAARRALRFGGRARVRVRVTLTLPQPQP